MFYRKNLLKIEFSTFSFFHLKIIRRLLYNFFTYTFIKHSSLRFLNWTTGPDPCSDRLKMTHYIIIFVVLFPFWKFNVVFWQKLNILSMEFTIGIYYAYHKNDHLSFIVSRDNKIATEFLYNIHIITISPTSLAYIHFDCFSTYIQVYNVTRYYTVGNVNISFSLEYCVKRKHRNK